jgi:hypothetical protein
MSSNRTNKERRFPDRRGNLEIAAERHRLIDARLVARVLKVSIVRSLAFTRDSPVFFLFVKSV